MRTLCDSCDKAAAIVFCAADEAALCRSCDDKVHMCNKLANRHIRVVLGHPSQLRNCDICDNTPAFFYCQLDGISLCLQCDTVVHVGGKRKHQRYLLFRQRVEFPLDKLANLDDDPSQTQLVKDQNLSPKLTSTANHHQNHRVSPVRVTEPDDDDADNKMDNTFIDLNSRPLQIRRLGSPNQEQGMNGVNGKQGMNGVNGTNHELADREHIK
ncbi:hypothetical protein ACFE04_003000 [Oxalis oulophora]